MKKYEENDKVSKAEEEGPNMKTFSSQEEAERYNMIQNINMSDMEKFKSFCQMMRLQKLFSRAKIYDYKDLK